MDSMLSSDNVKVQRPGTKLLSTAGFPAKHYSILRKRQSAERSSSFFCPMQDKLHCGQRSNPISRKEKHYTSLTALESHSKSKPELFLRQMLMLFLQLQKDLELQ